MGVKKRGSYAYAYFIVFTVLLILFIGCSTQSSPPAMPKLTTDRAKACARECQAINSECVEACSQMVGGMTTAMQRSKCLDNCNQTLADCYSTCE
jgi:hypothetical protein